MTGAIHTVAATPSSQAGTRSAPCPLDLYGVASPQREALFQLAKALGVTLKGHKASYSAEQGACVEVAEGTATGVRGTQNREVGALFFTTAEACSIRHPVRQQYFVS